MSLVPRDKGKLETRAISSQKAVRCCEEGLNRLEKNLLKVTSEWTEQATKRAKKALGIIYEKGEITLALAGATVVYPTVTPVVVAAPTAAGLGPQALVLGSAAFLANAYGALVQTQTLTDAAEAIIDVTTKTRTKLWDCEHCVRKRMFDQRQEWSKKKS